MASDFSIQKYQNLQNELENKLYEVPGSTSAGSEPTQEDIYTETQLIKTKGGLQRVLGQKRAEDWYGAQSLPKTTQKPKEGFVSKALNLLATPLYGVVGAVESALGKGTKRGLLENIKSNVQERGTFGDLLRSYKAPTVLSLPVGFALDVAMDPLNWITMGTAALVPKIAVGAAKAGLEGAALGAKSGILSKIAKLGKFIPGVKSTERYQSIAKDSVKLSDDYYRAINSEAGEVLRRTIDNPGWYRKTGENLEEFLNKSKSGQKALELFKYSPRTWFKTMKKIDEEDRAMLQGALSGKEIVVPMTEGNRAQFSLAAKAAGKDNIASEISDALDLSTTSSRLARTDNPAEVALRMSGEAEIDKTFKEEVLNKLREFTAIERTGSEVLDNLYNSFRNLKVGNVEVGQKIADAYNIFINGFKQSKIGLSPTAYVNAVVGNLAMAQMSGLSVSNPNFGKYVLGAWKMINGKGSKDFLGDIIKNPEWSRFLEQYPGLFSRVFGYHPSFLKGRQGLENLADQFIDVIKKQGGEIDLTKFTKEKGEVVGALERSRRNLDEAGIVAGKLKEKMGGVASQVLEDAGLGELRGGTSYISSELYQGAFRKLVNNLKEQAAGGGKLAGLMYSYFTKPMDWYEQIDQSYKLGTALYLSQHGIDRRELMMLKNFFKIAPQDVQRTLGADVFKLIPERATEAAQDIFMNYGAMPGFVKIIRSLPFFGAPFASFSYAMTSKLGKTLKYNPAIFNKINLLLQEISGARTPLEKETLKSPYYQFLNRPGMVKLNNVLPFFGDNPVYLNAMNMLPYYTLNIFQPAERSYLDSKMNTISAIKDRVPFLQTPEGQIMWDYFIQPLILRDSNPPEEAIGSFGQPLYPQGASSAEKYVGYPLRSIAESVVPPISGLAGFATSKLPDSAVDYLPNYRWRQVSYALQGKGSTGVPSKEPALQRTLRALSSTMGIPLYQLELRFSKQSNNK
jgi:hypothetical protein